MCFRFDLQFYCSGYGCDRVNFLHSGWHGVVFWIQKNNLGVLVVYLSSIIPSHELFSFSYYPGLYPAVQMLNKTLGGVRTRISGPNWPKKYSMPYNIILNKLRGVGQGACHFGGTGWTSVDKWWEIALYIICFMYSFLSCRTVFVLPISFIFLSWFSPPHHWEGARELLCPTYCNVKLNPNIY